MYFYFYYYCICTISNNILILHHKHLLHLSPNFCKDATIQHAQARAVIMQMPSSTDEVAQRKLLDDETQLKTLRLNPPELSGTDITTPKVTRKDKTFLWMASLSREDREQPIQWKALVNRVPLYAAMTTDYPSNLALYTAYEIRARLQSRQPDEIEVTHSTYTADNRSSVRAVMDIGSLNDISNYVESPASDAAHVPVTDSIAPPQLTDSPHEQAIANESSRPPAVPGAYVARST